MTTDEMLRALKERGLDVVLRPDGTPAFVGPAKEVTTRLLNAMRWHREEIVRRLEAVKPVGECPACGKGLDAKKRCWALKCGWRKCATCDNATGNVFFAFCLPCEGIYLANGGKRDD